MHMSQLIQSMTFLDIIRAGPPTPLYWGLYKGLLHPAYRVDCLHNPTRTHEKKFRQSKLQYYLKATTSANQYIWLTDLKKKSFYWVL
jgi:hypothetical protein